MGNRPSIALGSEYAPRKIDHSTKSELREPGPTHKDFEETLRNYGPPFINNGDQGAEKDIETNASIVRSTPQY